jgi:hypothetical protein
MFRQMQVQTETAQKQLEQSDRAWLTMDISADSQFEFTKSGEATITVRPHIKNIGKSVATGVIFDAKLFLQDPENGTKFFHEPIDQQTEMCEKIARTPLISGGEANSMALVIFPNDTNQELGHGFTIPRAEIEKRKKPVKLKSEDAALIFPVLVGCVDYQYATATQHHQTRFVYLLEWIDRTIPPGFVNEVAIKVGTPVVNSDVVFQKWSFGGFYAY